MKKLLSILLVLTIIMMVGSFSFAAEGDVIVEETKVPGAPAENVDDTTYSEPQILVDEEEIPGGPGTLPKTGGIPAEAFYAAGLLLVVAGLIISMKKAKPAPKN